MKEIHLFLIDVLPFASSRGPRDSDNFLTSSLNSSPPAFSNADPTGKDSASNSIKSLCSDCNNNNNNNNYYYYSTIILIYHIRPIEATKYQAVPSLTGLQQGEYRE